MTPRQKRMVTVVAILAGVGVATAFALQAFQKNLLYYYSPSFHPDTYTGAILLRVPIFTGWKNTYDVLKAREDAQVQWAQVETLTDQVILQVWTSYYNLKTASQQVRTARDLGYDVVVVSDCCYNVNKELHEWSLANIMPIFARVLTSDEVLGLLV